MTMCTCNHQLQPHDWIEGVCPKRSMTTTPWSEVKRTRRPMTAPNGSVDMVLIGGEPEDELTRWLDATAAAERDPQDIYRDLGGEG